MHRMIISIALVLMTACPYGTVDHEDSAEPVCTDSFVNPKPGEDGPIDVITASTIEVTMETLECKSQDDCFVVHIGIDVIGCDPVDISRLTMKLTQHLDDPSWVLNTPSQEMSTSIYINGSLQSYEDNPGAASARALGHYDHQGSGHFYLSTQEEIDNFDGDHMHASALWVWVRDDLGDYLRTHGKLPEFSLEPGDRMDLYATYAYTSPIPRSSSLNLSAWVTWTTGNTGHQFYEEPGKVRGVLSE